MLEMTIGCQNIHILEVMTTLYVSPSSNLWKSGGTAFVAGLRHLT